MATRPGTSLPSCFISYSWDSDRHKDWVRDLATKLQTNGVRMLLDQWECQPGADFFGFMERSIAEAQYVLVVCTPTILQKEARGYGGVFYESRIIRAELFYGGSAEVIPVLREGTVRTAVPAALRGRVLVDFSDDRKYAEALDELLRRIHGRPRYEQPPLGPAPPFEARSDAVQDDPAVPADARARPSATRTSPRRAFDAFFAELDSVHRRLHPIKVRVFYGVTSCAFVLLLLSGGVLVRQGFRSTAATMGAWLSTAMFASLLSLAAAWLYRKEERCEQSVAWCRMARDREDHQVAARAVGVLTCYGWLKRQFQDDLREFTK